MLAFMPYMVFVCVNEVRSANVCSLEHNAVINQQSLNSHMA